MSAPIQFEWDGEAMVPVGRFWARKADEQFVVGDRYRMVEEADRSMASHKHEFAFLSEAWNSLPDELHAQYPSPEHLRKYGLIAKGFCTMKQHACMSAAEAARLELALNGEKDDPYVVIVRRGSVVTTYRAVSQSRRAMGAPQFQQSKQALMEFVGDLLGVAPEDLQKVARAA